MVKKYVWHDFSEFKSKQVKGAGSCFSYVPRDLVQVKRELGFCLGKCHSSLNFQPGLQKH